MSAAPWQDRSVKGFLFDIDGTLANTDPTHFEVFQELLLKEPSINGGKPIDEAFFRSKIAGRQNLLIMKDLFPSWTKEKAAAWSLTKEARFREVAAATMVKKTTAGLPRLIDFIQAKQMQACAVTNAPRVNAEAILEGIGFADFFGERLIIGDECERAKPDPLPYRLGAAAIGVAPEDCVVFEDSPAGAVAGKAAGAVVVGILSGQSWDALEAAGCDLIVGDMEDEALWRFLERATS